MATPKSKEKKAEINWLFPDENQTVTLDDFREMVQEAENQPAYSYQEHRKIVNEWLQNHR
jgi:ABC-type thiamine transport system substrate-binding protein